MENKRGRKKKEVIRKNKLEIMLTDDEFLRLSELSEKLHINKARGGKL